MLGLDRDPGWSHERLDYEVRLDGDAASPLSDSTFRPARSA
jgi:hypothetical protein